MEATLASIVAAASPLVYAVVGETITEKAGVVNLSMEGTIMLSAMTGFAVSYTTGSVLAGFLAAMVVGMLIAALVAFASIELRLNQIAVGFVLALLAVELSSFLGDPYVGQQGPSVRAIDVPLLSDIPFLGRILFQHNLSVYGSYVATIGAYVFMFHTRRGLEMQGVGERADASFARGIDVNRLRYLYTIVGGGLAGVAGAAFSLDVKLGWREGLTTNFGWIALAIVIFGGWHPLRAASGAYLFGVLQTVSLKLQPVFPGVSQILPLLPFVLMIFALVLVYLRLFRELGDRHPMLRHLLIADPPSGLGTTFHRE
ncbi:MAG TPA: ABC transporter permease [Actinomycetota bacterium]|nr:ABC transporter permease [Actinomycetota bacterium]